MKDILVRLRQQITELEAPGTKRERHRDHLEELMGERTAELKALNWRLREQITEYKRVMEALRESEEFRSSLLANSPHPIEVVSLDTSLRYVNPALEKLTGFTSTELIGKKPPYPYWTEETLLRISGDFEGALTKGIERVEELFQRKNGERFWVEITFEPIIYNGEPKYYLANWVDITERRRAEETLQAEKNKLQSVIDAIEYGLSIQDKDYNILYQSQPMVKIAGDHLGEKCYRAYESRGKVCDGCPVEQAFQDGKSHTSERKVVTPSGRVVFLEHTANPIRDAKGDVVSCVEIPRNITERKQMEEALQQSNERFRDITENALEWVWEVDASGKYTYSSPVVEKILGYKPGEVLEKRFYDLFHPDDREELKKAAFETFAQGQPFRNFLNRTIHRNGEVVWLSTSGVPILDKEGNLLGYRGADVDITERKRAEEALRESEEKYRTIFENVSEVIIRVNRYGKIVDINGRAEECFGYKPGEVIGKNFAKTGVLSLKDMPKIVKLFGEIIRGKRAPFVIELEAKRKDGSPILIEVNSKLVKKNGKAEGFVAIVRDITERKRAEETLQAEKNKLQSVIDAIEHGLSIVDRDYDILYQSEPSVITGGYHPGEKCYRVYEGQDKVCDGCPVEQAFRDGKPHTSERRVVAYSGEVFFLENTASPIRDAEGKIGSCLEVTRNITEHKRAEAALRESEEKYRGLVTNVRLGVFRSTPEPAGRFLEVNPAMEEITGYSREELLKMDVADLYVNPEERQAILEEIASGGGKPTREARLRKRDGTEIVISDTKVAVRDCSGKIIYFDGIMEDITERKRAEGQERRLQRELNLASRLAAVGELAAGVAHEINNPLTGILGFSQRLLRRSTDGEVRRDLERIHNEAQRAAKVVKNLLAFARRREPKKEYADIGDILRMTLDLRVYELKTGNIEVALDLAPNLCEVMVDIHQIQEVFLNIILNAEQAMIEAHSGGKLAIKTEMVEGYNRISFTDDGPGVPAEKLDRLFDPFFTTRGERGGTGLGLSLCHGIVTDHGGKIYARSKAGKGAIFFVELPCTRLASVLPAHVGNCA